MNKEILRLAIPNILSNLTVPLLGLVDTIVLGHLDSPIYLGAIAIGGMIFNFVYWGFGFLRMGTTGLTAQAFGQDNKQDSILTLGRALVIAFASALLLILGQFFIERLAFSLIEGDEEVFKEAASYFYIRIYAAPATIGLYAFIGWFLGMQNSKVPLYITLVINIANIVFNLWFILGMGMKTAGAAWGTLGAQYLGLLIAIWFFYRKYYSYLEYWNGEVLFEIKALKRFLGVNLDIFIRTICLIFTFSFFIAKSSSLGVIILAANQLLMQLYHLMAYGIDGFAFAAESLTGKYLGNANKEKLMLSIRKLLFWGIGLGAAFSCIYFLAGKQLLELFTDQEAVIKTGMEYLPWMIMLPVISAAAFMWDGIYIGATATKAMRNTLLISTFVIFFPLYLILFPRYDNHGLWIAMVIFLLARSAIMTWWFKKAVVGQL